MPIMIKHMESQASLAKSNHQVDSHDWGVAGMKIRHRNGLIMKSSVGGWLLIVHVYQCQIQAPDLETVQK